MKRILIVDDDVHIGNMLEESLSKEGYAVSRAYSGTEAVLSVSLCKPDLVLLDLMLPGLSGEEVLPKLRGIPVIVMSAKASVDSKVELLLGGAADYVTKPFSVTVLCKKVAAVFANLELRTPRHDLFDDGFLKIDFSEQRASLAGKPLDFTPKEYRTLFLFVKNPRIILTKRQILEKLWDIDGDFVDEHTLTTIISRIRKKIETDEHKYIKTAYGMGYQWIGGEQA